MPFPFETLQKAHFYKAMWPLHAFGEKWIELNGQTWSTDKIDPNFLEKIDEVNYRKPLHDGACSFADVFTQVFI